MINIQIDKHKINRFTASGDISTITGELMLSVALAGLNFGDVDEFWDSMISVMSDDLSKQLAKSAVAEMLKECNVTHIVEEVDIK